MSLITPSIIQTLTALYDAPTRHYHTTAHVSALLDLLKTHHSHFTDPYAVEAAIWFHDAIYDVHAPAGQNEIESAGLAVRTLQQQHGIVEPESELDIVEPDSAEPDKLDKLDSTRQGIDADRLERIRIMVEATATHTAPSAASLLVPEGSPEVQDAKLFLDMDLSILAAEPSEFNAYEKAVRQEYGHVSDTKWREGRARVLKGFLARERIYLSDLFNGLLEERARVNLKNSIATLESEGQ